MQETVIDQYEQGIKKLRQAVQGLSANELRRAPDPKWNVGQWSISQLLVHLQDAETAFADRVRRIVAEDHPTIQAWDENRFIERLHYGDQSAEDAMAMIELIRRQLTRVLRKISSADLQRTGQHSLAGQQTANDVLTKAVWHLDHHLKFVLQKREKFGKPVTA